MISNLFPRPGNEYSGVFVKKQLYEYRKYVDIELYVPIDITPSLSLIKNKLSKAFLMLQIQEELFTVNDIYNIYKGKSLEKDMGIIEVYDLHNERIKRLIGKEIVLVTYQKYLESEKHLKDFIRHQFKSSDKPLRELKMSFITDYNYYLQTEKNFQQSTLNKAIQRFRKVVKFAIGHDYLEKDPFLLYRAKSVKKEVIFLLVQFQNHYT